MNNNIEDIFNILTKEIQGLTRADINTLFVDLNIDSFGFLSLRARLEQLAGNDIPDDLWQNTKCPADIFPLVIPNNSHMRPDRSLPLERRKFNVNMPQMAMGGLSESWLFKELGDIHWSMITNGLECPSSALADSNGNRLYATFTRICVSFNPLPSYEENSHLLLETSSFARFGAGMFFSDINIEPGGQASIMSSFAMRGESGSNTTLLKGQPQIQPNCQIRQLTAYPQFADEYRTHRKETVQSTIFAHEYKIVPQHDINGVGLLYFAAYPIIAEICLQNYSDQSYLATVKKDLFYFGNCNESETLVFQLHRYSIEESTTVSEASIQRKSDGMVIAYVITTKEAAK